MPLSESQLQEAEARLGKLPPSLLQAFRESVASLPAELSDQQVELWLEEGFQLSAHSLRSWEPSADYYRLAAPILLSLDEASFRQWVATGRELAEHASAIACAYFRASPEVLPMLTGGQVREWAFLGDRLYKATWKSISLASEFLNLSPNLLKELTIPEMGRLVRVIESISDRSADLAAACLEASPSLASTLNQAERLAFLDFAGAISESAWPEASLYFQRGPELLTSIDPAERAHYLDLCARVAQRLGRQAYNLFAEGTHAFKEIDEAEHGRTIDLAGGLVGLSPIAAMSFIKSVPSLVDRLRADDLKAWHGAGLEILRQTQEGGEAYFRLESAKAEQMVSNLSARVELATVSELLRLYSKALTGINVSVQPVNALEEKGIGWVSERGPSTEGTSIFLPEHIEEFENKPDNFSVFKIYATHQTAHLEFGSFDFSYRRAGGRLPRRRHLVERQRRADGLLSKRRWVTDMEHFFDLFDERQMASDLFTVTEDLRIDQRIAKEYPGVRRAAGLVQVIELGRRPSQRTLPLRQAFIENLVRVSLDGESTISFPKPLEPILASAITTLFELRQEGTTVEDAAESALTLYEMAEKIPNLPPEALQDMEWSDISQEMLEQMQEEGSDGVDVSDGLGDLPDGEEMPYESPDQVDFRGDFKPEMVQLLMRMRMQQTDEQTEEDLSALTEEQIKELLEKSVEVDMEEDAEQISATISAFLENLEREAGQQLPDDDAGEGEEPEPEAPAPSPEVKLFYYDEWDFRAYDYKPRWCTVRERVLEQGSEEFYEKTLHQYAGLVSETQRQFELLKPDNFRKIKRLEDGEDIDIDAAIEFMVQKKAGHGDVPKIYWRRNKIERDVAVAFLLDMSASTDEEIEKHRPKRNGDATDGNSKDATGDQKRYYQSVAQERSQNGEPPKRIIDLERESMVLLTHALEVIGDRYGIYGFSGYGRDNVEYFVIKDFDEFFGDDVRRRIDKVMPIRSTRMGPAIRHTAAKLEEANAKAKILFLVSDGRPQDHGYGRDRTEKDYAIHDTHKALIEAKNLGITPFALTVDKEGHDYLGAMCGDIAYEVLGDISLLPSRLPTLYRRLTV